MSFPDAPRLVIEGLGRGSERSIFYSATYGQVSGSCRWFFGAYAHGIGRVSHMSMRYSLMATLQRIDR